MGPKIMFCILFIIYNGKGRQVRGRGVHRRAPKSTPDASRKGLPEGAPILETVSLERFSISFEPFHPKMSRFAGNRSTQKFPGSLARATRRRSGP